MKSGVQGSPKPIASVTQCMQKRGPRRDKMQGKAALFSPVQPMEKGVFRNKWRPGVGRLISKRWTKAAVLLGAA